MSPSLQTPHMKEQYPVAAISLHGKRSKTLRLLTGASGWNRRRPYPRRHRMVFDRRTGVALGIVWRDPRRRRNIRAPYDEPRYLFGNDRRPAGLDDHDSLKG